MSRENLKAYLEKQILDIKHYLKINGRKEDEDGFSPSEDLQICNIAKNTIDLEEQLGCPLEKLIQFSKQETVYTIYGTHTNEIVIVDLNLGRIHISINGDINNSYCVYFKDYKKTWWLREDKSE